MTQSMKISKTKLTSAEIAVVTELLDGFESSGFVGLNNLGSKSLAYIKRWGMRFEVLTAVAQSAVIDHPEKFGPMTNSRLMYNFLISHLMFLYKDDARITYDEGNGSVEDFRIMLAFSPPTGGNCLTDYDFVLDTACITDLWELVPYDWANIETRPVGSSISSLKRLLKPVS